MPTYVRDGRTDIREIDRWHDGRGWLARPTEDARRASHAIRAERGSDDGRVWLFDPLDGPGVDDLVAELGGVAGVAVCSNYHARDAGTIAERHDVPVWIPEWMDRVAERVDAPIRRYGGERDERDAGALDERDAGGPDAGDPDAGDPDDWNVAELGDSGFRIRRSEPLPGWREAVAYRPSDGTLYVPDLLGTAPLFTVGDERLGVYLLRRPVPPRDLFDGLGPERILVGHGEGVFDAPSAALADALAGARRRFPRALLASGPAQVRALVGAIRS